MARNLLNGVGFIAGSASGIGQSTAFAFARAGVRGLVLADINDEVLKKTVKEIQAETPILEIVALPMDSANENSCVESMDKAFKAFGRIDYVVNNIGIGGTHTPTYQQTTAELHRVFNVNFIGLWSGRGVITNTASILGLVGGIEGGSPYVASKHAIVRLTKNEAATYGPKGIRVNSICPGYLSTAILGNNDPHVRAAIEQAIIPLVHIARLGEPEEIADCIVFLSPRIASYVNGASLAADGGYTAI